MHKLSVMAFVLTIIVILGLSPISWSVEAKYGWLPAALIIASQLIMPASLIKVLQRK